jgi:GntR family transcriptional regulator
MAFLIHIDTGDPLPIYAQLERGIRSLVASGKIKEGEQLPTVRQMAVELKINANTVAKVYAELERAGFIQTKRGVGTFVVRQNPKELLRDRKRELAALTKDYVQRTSELGFSIKDIIEFITIHHK